MKPLSLTKSHLIIMVGIPGSGKSFFAENFSNTFKAPIINLDNIRQKLFKSPTFSKSEDEIINSAALYMLDEILKTERTAIYDGQTSRRKDRNQIVKKAKSIGYEPLFVWVQTEPITAKRRATKVTAGRPRLSIEEFESRLRQFDIPNRVENTIVISGKHTYASQLKIVLKHLAQPQTTTQPETISRPGRRSIIIN